MATHTRQVKFSHLDGQFVDIDAYWEDIRALVRLGDFTLGAAVTEFERRFAELCRVPHAIGVGSGTDALILSLRMLGIGPGDEVVTTPMTFIATVGAIVATGATPVFVDSDDGFVIDPDQINEVISAKTKAILAVHYTGNIADMPRIVELGARFEIPIIEDACQSVMGEIDGRAAGSWGEMAAFSLHPLKNLNVWGDGGVITTQSDELAERLRKYRNHGLANRDEVMSFGINSRLDSIQAVVGNRLMGEVLSTTERRIANAAFYDKAFASLGGRVQVPRRRPGVRHVYHLYMIRVDRRDDLLRYLIEHGVEAKVHYPTPIHLQPAASYLGYSVGSFPQCEADCRSIITLPVHQHLKGWELEYVVEQVWAFYS